MSGRAIYIAAAKRTPFGSFGGSLKSHSATKMGTHASVCALSAANLPASAVSNVTVGMVSHSSSDSAYAARHIALSSKVPLPVPALSINRLCGSGFQTVITAAEDILINDIIPRSSSSDGPSMLAQNSKFSPRMKKSDDVADEDNMAHNGVALAVGTESMSLCPHTVRGIRWGAKLGADIKLEDSLWDALTDSYAGVAMAITAENLAEKYGISREDCDAFALRSQQKWAEANSSGVFASEIAPVELFDRRTKSTIAMDTDEHPKPKSTMESLSKLPAVFKKNGTVTAGNASGISDGAGAIVVASENAISEFNMPKLARVVGWHVAGVEPTEMGIGPVPAIRGLLAKTGLQIADIDLFDVNEAFAAQFLAVQKELEIDDDKINQCGGAIALGHPLAASGSRILAHLAHRLNEDKDKKYAIGSACIGGGQGIAVLLESVH